MDRIRQAIQLLKDEKLRGFRVDIETDSTVAGDSEQEKESRVEFIKAVTEFMKAGAEIAAQEPSSVPLLGKLLQFGVRGFRVGRDLEASIEEFVDEAEKSAKARAANPPPNPEMMKAQAEIEAQKIEAQSEAQNSQMESQRKNVDLQIAQTKAQADMAKAAADADSDRQKAELERARMAMEMETERELARIRIAEANMKMDHARELHQHDLEKAKVATQAAKKNSQQPAAH